MGVLSVVLHIEPGMYEHKRCTEVRQSKSFGKPFAQDLVGKPFAYPWPFSLPVLLSMHKHILRTMNVDSDIAQHACRLRSSTIVLQSSSEPPPT